MPTDKPQSDPAALFATQGFLEYAQMDRHPAAYALYDKIYASRPFDQALFLSQEEWESGDKSHKHTNPRIGKNVLEPLQDQLAFVEANPELHRVLVQLLGEDFRWLFRKVVCRIPRNALPQWLDALIGGKPANTLGAFIRPEYRDISYYLENDLHQDIQDYPRLPEDKKEHRVLSLYVHLSDITPQDAPLYLMPGTHNFGATSYQHDIHKIDAERWRYRDDSGRAMETRLHPVLGPAGHIAMWHSCLIHGAHPVRQGKPRLVLRYMLAQSLSGEPCGLEAVNAAIQGPLYPDADYSPGLSAKGDGSWDLRETDFTAMG